MSDLTLIHLWNKHPFSLEESHVSQCMSHMYRFPCSHSEWIIISPHFQKACSVLIGRTHYQSFRTIRDVWVSLTGCTTKGGNLRFCNFDNTSDISQQNEGITESITQTAGKCWGFIGDISSTFWVSHSFHPLLSRWHIWHWYGCTWHLCVMLILIWLGWLMTL